MNTELYEKLVDLYAGDELSQELMDELETAAFSNPALSHDMHTLRTTVLQLRSLDAPQFTEESYQRVMMKIGAKGGVMESKSPTPTHWQYRLPIAG